MTATILKFNITQIGTMAALTTILEKIKGHLDVYSETFTMLVGIPS